jgi:serine/threonine protein kinase
MEYCSRGDLQEYVQRRSAAKFRGTAHLQDPRITGANGATGAGPGTSGNQTNHPVITAAPRSSGIGSNSNGDSGPATSSAVKHGLGSNNNSSAPNAHSAADAHLLPESLLWRFSSQLVSAISHLHSQRIIHRDLKPLNVFICPQEQLKVGDLGVAKLVEQDLVGGQWFHSKSGFALRWGR